jgi:hypothetical protein
MKKSKRSTHGNSIGGGGEHDDANRCRHRSSSRRSGHERKTEGIEDERSTESVIERIIDGLYGTGDREGDSIFRNIPAAVVNVGVEVASLSGCTQQY